MPKNLSYLDFDTSKIKCIPNPVVGFSYPICNATNNINGCPSTGFANVEGKVFYDYNANGIKDGIEIYSDNTKIDFAGISSVKTNSNGYYNFATDSLATYTITPTSPIANTAFNPQFAAITFNKIDTTVTQDFAIQPTVTKDSIEVYITTNNLTHPGGWVWYQVDIKNAGTTNLTNVSSSINYNNTQLTVNSGTNLTFTIPVIPFGGHSKYYGWFYTKTIVAIGDTITLNATATNGSLLISANAQTIVSASYDPNDKTATPELSTQQVTEGKKIDYTIRFQNTGTDTAFHIVVADTLDSKLDFSTMQMVATSHNCKTTIKDNIIFFEMRDIMLPDSNVNKVGSNGFVRFTMQPKATVVAGDTIPNKAAIYFDYNKPVITNTAITHIKNNVLPVRLTAYDVRLTNEKQVLNSWTTASEINTSYFIIQRSEDGRVYKSVGKVTAKGFGSYEFVDVLLTNNLPPTIYYRLQIVDKDGSSQFSKVKTITINYQLSTISLFPNPAKDFVTIDCKGAKELVITDYVGRVVYKSVVNSPSTIVNLKSFAKGIYIFSFDNGEKVKVMKE